MKRGAFVIAVLALFSIPGPVAAEGGRNAAAAVGAIGGFALGAAVGSAAAAPRPVYVAPGPVYEAPRRVYVERRYLDEDCYIRRDRVWVPGWGWELRRRTICY
jgi:hypothetical protein